MPGRLLVWGAGGHGKVVAELARDNGWEVVGFIDADSAKLDLVVDSFGTRIVVTESDFKQRWRERALPEQASAVALGVGDNAARLLCAEIVGEAGPGPLIHSRSYVSPSASLGAGSVVFPGAIVNTDVSIGRAVIINSGAIVEHDCVIGDGVHISPAAVLTGGVQVSKGAWVGACAVLLPGVNVGLRATVGAGAIVLHDVPDGTTVVGNPARRLRSS